MKEEQKVQKYDEENPECPYCGRDDFDNPTEEGIHRSQCQQAAFDDNPNIPTKPDPSGKGENVVDQYEKNNRRPGKE